MGRIFLVIGGRRSGKSDFALRLGESLNGPHAFIATCPSIDQEMDDRIKRHQHERNSRIWTTIEEEIKLDEVITRNGHFNLFLVDCVTLWINNLIFHSSEKKKAFSEQMLIELTQALLEACSVISGDVIFVSNETGLGVVPENPETRFFLDLLGRCNQLLASASEEVFMVCCGIPVKLKRGNAQ